MRYLSTDKKLSLVAVSKARLYDDAPHPWPHSHQPKSSACIKRMVQAMPPPTKKSRTARTACRAALNQRQNHTTELIGEVVSFRHTGNATPFRIDRTHLVASYSLPIVTPHCIFHERELLDQPSGSIDTRTWGRNIVIKDQKSILGARQYLHSTLVHQRRTP